MSTAKRRIEEEMEKNSKEGCNWCGESSENCECGMGYNYDEDINKKEKDKDE